VLAQRAVSEGPRLGILARLGVPVGGRVRKLRAVGGLIRAILETMYTNKLGRIIFDRSLRPCLRNGASWRAGVGG
jgi:hypothetical protein